MNEDEQPVIRGRGPLPPLAVVLGGWPDLASESADTPFMGVAGQLLDGMMTAAGLKREELYLTYAVKYIPQDETDMTEVRSRLRPLLEHELVIASGEGSAFLQCRLMIVLGLQPALMIWGKEAMRKTGGQVEKAEISGQEWTAVISHDPAEAVRSGAVKEAMRGHFVMLYNLACENAKRIRAGQEASPLEQATWGIQYISERYGSSAESERGDR